MSSIAPKPNLATLRSLLNSLHTLPPTPQLLLPQTNPIITPTNRQHIPRHTPTDPPHHNIKIQRLALPRPRIAHLPTRRQRPNPNRMILRRRSQYSSSTAASGSTPHPAPNPSALATSSKAHTKQSQHSNPKSSPSYRCHPSRTFSPSRPPAPSAHSPTAPAPSPAPNSHYSRLSCRAR